jgi:hypothetical protein
MVSPDTRAVLLSGEHPMLANGAGANGIQNMTPTTTPESQMSGQTTADGTNGRNDGPAWRNQNLGGRRSALQGRAIGNIPQLAGVAQIVGLALGSPEFQRH